MKRKWGWLVVIPLLAMVILCAAGIVVLRTGLGPFQQDEITHPRIYAYRDWQSVGVQVNPGNRLYIRARGTWLYTPGEYHGPGGHAHYRAPNTYPIPGIPGGMLLGRVGETGQVFAIGSGGTYYVNEQGLLYLRINDDILSDNEGYVTVEVEIMPPEEN